MAQMKKNCIFQPITILVLVTAAAAVTAALYFNKPEVEKVVPTVKRPTLVETMTARPSDERVNIVAYGTVQPNRQLTLQAEVNGRVIEMSENLDAGGLVKEGEILLKIDPRHYVTAVEQEKAAVQRAEFELQVEEGQQLVAKREWELLEPSVKTNEIGKQLALREPHIKQKVAALSAAKSKLEKALLDLKRTILFAPFNGFVSDEFVEVGQLISAQTKIATLISTNEFRVQVSIPYDQLAWVQMPSAGSQGSPVTVTQDLGGGQEIQRRGEVLRLLGSLDSNSGMVRLLVVIQDPLGLSSPDFNSVPLLIGTRVGVEIEGPILSQVFALPRVALRENDCVWVVSNDNTLEIRDVTIASRAKETVIVTGGLNPGEKVVTSAIAVPVPGMELRTISAPTPSRD